MFNKREMLSFACSLLLVAALSPKAWAQDFYMAITADPQLEWRCGEGTLCARKAKSLRDQAILSNRWQTNSINKLVRQYGSSFKGVIVNGDLTAFGHSDQFKMYKQYFEDRIKARVYPGLGNHDYANNVNDCFENNCARGMVDFLAKKVRSLPGIKSFDYKVGKVYYEFPSLHRNHRGSLAYSFEIGGVHFIQMNNYPSYRTHFKGWNFLGARMDHYSIRSAFAWLQKDLTRARAAGKTIIVNFHDFDQHMSHAARDRLRAMMAQHKVAGVFWGHIHELVGRSGNGGQTPGFRSGSSAYNTYLLVHFRDNKLHEVSVIDSSYGGVSVRETYLLGE